MKIVNCLYHIAIRALFALPFFLIALWGVGIFFTANHGYLDAHFLQGLSAGYALGLISGFAVDMIVKTLK